MNSLATIPPYVAFYPEPATRQDRFLVQGYVDREQIAAAAQALIDLLDAIDGDPDLEDATDLEDDHALTPAALKAVASYQRAPGCPIADPGGGNVEDEGEGIDEREEVNDDAVGVYGIDQTKPPLDPYGRPDVPGYSWESPP